jgi:hypothetical protein
MPQSKKSFLISKAPSTPDPSNLMERPGVLADPPTTTYLLLAQQCTNDELAWLQEVELSLDEYQKLRNHLAQLRGLIPAKKSA